MTITSKFCHGRICCFPVCVKPVPILFVLLIPTPGGSFAGLKWYSFPFQLCGHPDNAAIPRAHQLVCLNKEKTKSCLSSGFLLL